MPTTGYSANPLSADQIALAAIGAGWQGNDLNIAVAVALAESSGKPDQATAEPNGTMSYGLWQINSVHPDLLKTGSWSDPAANAKMAHTLWASQGWRPWSTYKTGAYLMYMTQAKAGVAKAGQDTVNKIVDSSGLSQSGSGNMPYVDQLVSTGFPSLGIPSVKDLASGVANVAQAIYKFDQFFVKVAEGIVAAAKWIGNPDNWIRVLKVLLGSGLVIAGLSIASKPYTQPAMRTASKVARVVK